MMEKFPNIFVSAETYDSLCANDKTSLQMLSTQDLSNLEINRNAILLPVEDYLWLVFDDAHHNTSAYKPGDDDEVVRDLKSGMKRIQEFENFLSAFIVRVNQASNRSEQNMMKEYETVIIALRILNTISAEYVQGKALEHSALEKFYVLLRDWNIDEMFVPVPHTEFDKPDFKLNSGSSVTAFYDGKEHSLNEIFADIQEERLKVEITDYAVSSDPQLVLSILDYLSKNKRWIKKCPVCGKPFIVSTHRRKYCSRECRNNTKAKEKLGFPTCRGEVNYRQRFNKAYERCYKRNDLAGFDLKSLNIPEPEQRGTSAQRQELSKKRSYIVNALDSCCNKRYNHKKFRQAINELISYQQLRRDWGFISQKEYENWLDNSKINRKVGRKPISKA